MRGYHLALVYISIPRERVILALNRKLGWTRLGLNTVIMMGEISLI